MSNILPDLCCQASALPGEEKGREIPLFPAQEQQELCPDLGPPRLGLLFKAGAALRRSKKI